MAHSNTGNMTSRINTQTTSTKDEVGTYKMAPRWALTWPQDGPRRSQQIIIVVLAVGYDTMGAEIVLSHWQ